MQVLYACLPMCLYACLPMCLFTNVMRRWRGGLNNNLPLSTAQGRETSVFNAGLDRKLRQLSCSQQTSTNKTSCWLSETQAEPELPSASPYSGSVPEYCSPFTMAADCIKLLQTTSNVQTVSNCSWLLKISVDCIYPANLWNTTPTFQATVDFCKLTAFDSKNGLCSEHWSSEYRISSAAQQYPPVH